jgi:hypothetical protein
MTTIQITDSAPLEEPLAELERQLISEFLAAAGQDLHALLMRHDEAATKLLTEASLYASARLTEVASRSHYLRKLHGEP